MPDNAQLIAPEQAHSADSRIKPPPELKEMWDRHLAIVKLGDPVLRKVARPITSFTQQTRDLIARMTAVMREANGLGLAAPQVGVSSRLIIYDANNGKGLQVLVNPVILGGKGEQLEPTEGCLSIPGLQGVVPRSKEIRVKGFDERGRPVSRRVSDLEARVIQHEIDHLNGVLFIDRADPETLVWVIDDDENEAE